MEISELRRTFGLRALDATDDRAVRQCLRCNIEFESQWSGNRICPDCTVENAEMGPYAEYITVEQQGISDYTEDNIETPWIDLDETYHEKHKRMERLRHLPKRMTEDSSPPVWATSAKGLVISSSHLLPAPCDIQSLPDDILKIRTALRRRNLQCFEVSEPLTEAQIAELDRGLQDCHSWILLSRKVGIDTESFENSVIEQ